MSFGKKQQNLFNLVYQTSRHFGSYPVSFNYKTNECTYCKYWQYVTVLV